VSTPFSIVTSALGSFQATDAAEINIARAAAPARRYRSEEAIAVEPPVPCIAGTPNKIAVELSVAPSTIGAHL
jgi:hypothetical protein